MARVDLTFHLCFDPGVDVALLVPRRRVGTEEPQVNHRSGARALQVYHEKPTLVQICDAVRNRGVGVASPRQQKTAELRRETVLHTFILDINIAICYF